MRHVRTLIWSVYFLKVLLFRKCGFRNGCLEFQPNEVVAPVRRAVQFVGVLCE